jgi:hypothetical protein
MIIKKHWIFRNIFSIIGLYYHLCTYGESITKPLIWLLLIIVIGTLYWYAFFISEYDKVLKTIEMSTTYSSTYNLPLILKSFEQNNNQFNSIREIHQFGFNQTTKKKEISITNSTTINDNVIINSFIRTLSDIMSINEKVELGDIFIRISSLIVLGGLAISLRRRIERRFRH